VDRTARALIILAAAILASGALVIAVALLAASVAVRSGG
jgi:hypothetical protein